MKNPIKIWKEESLDLKEGSTPSIYQEHFGKFLERRKVTADEVAKWDKKKATSELLKYMGWLKKEGKAPKTRGLVWVSLKDFFKTVGKVKIDMKVPVKTRLRVYRDIIPTKEQLKQILDHSPIQGKLGESLMAFSGLSPADVVRLVYGDFKEYFEGDRKGATPLMLSLKRVKTGEDFVTFVPKQTLIYLEEWLRFKRRKGEVIEDNTRIFNWRKSSSMTHKQTEYIRKTGLPVRHGFRLRNYSLRKYFRRGLMGKADGSLAEFFMGHATDLPGIYAGLADLDPEAIEKAREEYIKALPDLVTEGGIGSDEFTNLRSKVNVLVKENQNLKERLNGLNNFLQVFKGLTPEDIERIALYIRKMTEQRAVKDTKEVDRTQRTEAENYGELKGRKEVKIK